MKLQPTMLQFGVQDNVFKTGTKWVCTLCSIVKTFRLSGKNAERESYHNLIRKQAVSVTFASEMAHFYEQNEKKQSIVSGGNFAEVTKLGQRSKFWKSFSCQNALLLITFHAGGKFFSCKYLKFRLNYVLRHSAKRKYQKYPENKSLWLQRNWLLCSIWDICWY